MTRVFLERTTEKYQTHSTTSSAVQYESTCIRCGGLMVTDFSMDLLFCIGETEFEAKRCVQCGEVVDPVILKNRRVRQAPTENQLAKSALPNNFVTEGP